MQKANKNEPVTTLIACVAGAYNEESGLQGSGVALLDNEGNLIREFSELCGKNCDLHEEIGEANAVLLTIYHAQKNYCKKLIIRHNCEETADWALQPIVEKNQYVQEYALIVNNVRSRDLEIVFEQIAEQNKYTAMAKKLARQGAMICDETTLEETYYFSSDVIETAHQKNIPVKGEKAIRNFLAYPIRTFKDYSKLGIGGIDVYTKMSLEELKENVGEETLEQFVDVPEEGLATVCRWYLRGLPIKDAIRKGEVDLETIKNADRNTMAQAEMERQKNG